MTREQITYVKKVLIDLQDLAVASYEAEDTKALEMVNKVACEIRDFLKNRNEGVKSPPRAKLTLVED